MRVFYARELKGGGGIGSSKKWRKSCFLSIGFALVKLKKLQTGIEYKLRLRELCCYTVWREEEEEEGEILNEYAIGREREGKKE